MLSWAMQKELVRTYWVEPLVREALKGVLVASQFERPDLGWIVKMLSEEKTSTSMTAPMTTTELREKILATSAPHIQAACEGLLPDLETCAIMDVTRAIETGRKFAAHQEALILAGQLPGFVKSGAWGEIRNRIEGLLTLAGQVAVDETGQDGLLVRRASEYTTERVSWLWRGFIPYGKVTTLEGDPGVGKSTILLDLASRVTQGSLMPLGDQNEYLGTPNDVVVLSAEDGASDTIRPRLEAAGADLGRIHLVSGVREGADRDERGVALDRDVMRLENYIVKTGAKLVIIDPVVAMLGPTVDFHRDQDVRRVLKSLAQVAERRKCAVVTIRHLNKDKSGTLISRGGGSIGFVAAVRVAMLVVKHPTSENDRVLAVYKTNLSKPPQPAIYRFKDSGNPDVASIEWVQRSNQTVQDLTGGGVRDG